MSRKEWRDDAQQIAFRISKSSPEYEALQEAAKATNVTVTTYVRQALREGLIKDGYLQMQENETKTSN